MAIGEQAQGPIAGATNSTFALDNVSASQSGSSYYVVITAPDGETTSSTPAELTVVAREHIVQLTLSKFADGSTQQYPLVQLFDHDKPATVENFIHYITSGAYSNMFFDRCVPGFVLQGGTYDAVIRTNAGPGPQVLNLQSDFGVSGANSGIPFQNERWTANLAMARLFQTRSWHHGNSSPIAALRTVEDSRHERRFFN